ncbi:NusA-like transcription termination signal-binding factor [Halalkalicoccus subterraneus]|uniref:NusA-like transcription termination signal-binding factor n=1 Tax=Halalkalicoccus subterraneus TaxID=2675002 RepID=UPI000EFBF36F|nr:NusA-like transcription termination signal-binding factor [Halalkalicoccus subterraneus]
MTRTLSDDARRHLAAFEDVTDANAVDCVIGEDRLVFVVSVGEMGQAIGPGGKTVSRLEDRFGKAVDLVEDADTPEGFVANALAPAAVYHVTISENETLVAYAEVAEEDRGVAIGTEGRNIETARLLANRHFDIDDIQLT